MSSADGIDSIASALLGPLDALRSRLLRSCGRSLGPWFADRAARTTAIGVFSVLVTFVLAVRLPLVTLALGPIVLGVPHLVADVRYLVVRRGLARHLPTVCLVLAPLALALLVPTFELAALTTLGAAFASRGRRSRRLVLVGASLGLLVIGRTTGHAMDVVLGHVHNAVAVGIWWTMRTDRRPFERVVPLAIVIGVLACAFAAPSLTSGYATFHTFDHVLPLDTLIPSLTPRTNPTYEVACAAVLTFAFGQAMHYAIWLRLIPEDARTRRAPRSFRSSFRALRSELGAWIVLGSVVVLVALAAWASLDLAAARDGYLRLALFHAPLELALIGLAWSEARRP